MPMMENQRPLVLRSVLFAPATRADVLAKLPRSQPDAAIIDLEDGVPFQAKDTARGIAKSAAETLTSSHPQLFLFVRINAVGTPWFADDVAQALTPSLTGVVLPKYESLEQLEQLHQALVEQGLGQLVVMAGIETALGVERVSQTLHAPIAAAYFGAEDFIADMGGERTTEGLEVLYARSRVALAARLAVSQHWIRLSPIFTTTHASLQKRYRLVRSAMQENSVSIPRRFRLPISIYDPLRTRSTEHNDSSTLINRRKLTIEV